MEDELVRQALERGCNQETVAEVFDVTRRTTVTKEKRARAYDFPLDALTGSGRPPKSQPTNRSTEIEHSEEATTGDSPDAEETEPAMSDTAPSVPMQSADDTDTTDDADETFPGEIWDEHHSALHPDNRDPEIAAMATKLDPDELQNQLPDGISPVQLLNAVMIASQS